MNEIPMASLAATVREPRSFQRPDPLPNPWRHSIVPHPEPLREPVTVIGMPPADCAGARLP